MAQAALVDRGDAADLLRAMIGWKEVLGHAGRPLPCQRVMTLRAVRAKALRVRLVARRFGMTRHARLRRSLVSIFKVTRFAIGVLVLARELERRIAIMVESGRDE